MIVKASMAVLWVLGFLIADLPANAETRTQGGAQTQRGLRNVQKSYPAGRSIDAQRSPQNKAWEGKKK